MISVSKIGLVFSSLLVGITLADERPNIILICADDMGYGDAACYGNTNIVEMPNVDRLAAEGVRFSEGYVTCPVCGPSRYGMLAGRYQQKFGIQWNPDTWSDLKDGREETPEKSRLGSQRTIDQALEAAGYVTGIAGKYNLPCAPKTSFKESYSVMGFGGNYFPDETGRYNSVDGYNNGTGNKRILWGPEREGDEYLTDRLGRQTIEFIERHQDEPFFFYLGFNAPHSPMQAKTSHKAQVAHLKTEALRMYGAMLISMDENIGKVLDTLERLDLSKKTIVAFVSDNGPTFAYNVKWPEDWPRELLGSAGSLRGYKGQIGDGGLKVPYIIKWPGKLKAGSVYDLPVSAMDFYPTFCAAVGAPIPSGTQLDGVDLLPYLTGKKAGRPHKNLFWHWEEAGAVRMDDWKLVREDKKLSLFNLAEDAAESKDLASEKPEKVEELLTVYQKFTANLPPVLNQRYRKKK